MDKVVVDTADTGISVYVFGQAVAAFSWVEGIDVEGWAQNFAEEIRSYLESRNNVGD